MKWADVKPLIEEVLFEIPNVKAIIFEPQGAPVAEQMKIATEKPKMTRSRALFVRLLELYGIPGYRLSKLEIQKLAYFLQVAGEPLKLRYIKHQYGPYADNLNHVLQKMEGHFIQGYSDRNQSSDLYVLAEGRKEAQAFLAAHQDSHEFLERVSNLITGFETPYGMEMLATVHWVATEDPQAAVNCERAIERVQEWSDRKRQLFKISHLRKAWQRLHEQNWLIIDYAQLKP